MVSFIHEFPLTWFFFAISNAHFVIILVYIRPAIIEDLDEDAAATVFQQAMQEGKAMCGKYPFERAELFKEQLLRSDPMIFCDLEEENA